VLLHCSSLRRRNAFLATSSCALRSRCVLIYAILVDLDLLRSFICDPTSVLIFVPNELFTLAHIGRSRVICRQLGFKVRIGPSVAAIAHIGYELRRPFVKANGFYKADVHTHRSVNTTAVQAHEDPEVHGCPRRVRVPAVHAQLVARHRLDELSQLPLKLHLAESIC